jgi:aspartate aminotransferase
VQKRFDGFYQGFTSLRNEGLKVDVISPQAAIYMTIRFDLKGMKRPDGKVLETTEDVSAYLLDAAGFAVVPFYAFGSPKESSWYRLSVGTCVEAEIPEIIGRIRTALQQLS